jgi:hypothetical protein
MEFKTEALEETVMWNDARLRFSHRVSAYCMLFKDEVHKRIGIASSSITLRSQLQKRLLCNIHMRYRVYVEAQSSTNLQSSLPISRQTNVLLSANGLTRHIDSCDVPHQVHPSLARTLTCIMPLHSKLHPQNPFYYRL